VAISPENNILKNAMSNIQLSIHVYAYLILALLYVKVANLNQEKAK